MSCHLPLRPTIADNHKRSDLYIRTTRFLGPNTALFMILYVPVCRRGHDFILQTEPSKDSEGSNYKARDIAELNSHNLALRFELASKKARRMS
ncbi:hypothetical protein TNCV_4373761 [Trichonephila clavipes]|uniref:Uncharacterized protein n=1 Tax=Trichonephila clavipes TaxID=2585209 RepID=A0A8X6R3U4_TRICX|nr:hypothetical protein TNCV_4373761 [Trichonephila clavipes]